MSVNIVLILEDVASLAAAAIALLAAYRSLTIARSLVTRVYRSRAYWLAALMIIFAAFDLSGDVTTSLGSDINTVLFFVFLFALLIFIDSNVAVAREIDFFHKDVLRWQTTRVPLFTVLVITSAIGIFGFASSASALVSGLVLFGYFTVLGVAFAYSGAAMILIARRTYDRTMKKFVKMLGFAILCYVLFLTLWIPLDAIYPSLGDVVTDFIAIGAAYFFYKAAMSLSPVGKVVAEVAS
jgi:hypothetical protein